MNRRSKVPQRIRFEIADSSAWHCCICGMKQGQIHHIDENPSNHAPENLAWLCLSCHGEAHSTHKLSGNLTHDSVSAAKLKWTKFVADTRAKNVLGRWSSDPDSWARWTYFNLDVLPQVLRRFGVWYPDEDLQHLESKGIVTPEGFPKAMVEPEQGPDELVTIFDRASRQYRSMLFSMYSDAILSLIAAAGARDFREPKTLEQLKAMALEGTLAVISRGFHFRSEPPRANGTQIRHATTMVCKARIRFTLQTEFMTGNSPLNVDLLGSSKATALVLIKHVGREQGATTIRCTALAMGNRLVCPDPRWPKISSK